MFTKICYKDNNLYINDHMVTTSNNIDNILCSNNYRGHTGPTGHTGHTGPTGPVSKISYKTGLPSTKNSTGNLGEICIDSTKNILYICTNTNTWRKINMDNSNFSNSGGFL